MGPDRWEREVTEFWAMAERDDPGAMLTMMEMLVARRPEGDPVALYELASVHDFLDRPFDAVPLYRQALTGGLDAEREQRAWIQLASSLRVLGRADEAVGVLTDLAPSPVVGRAREAFLALALHDQGHEGEALQVALHALAPTLPEYGPAVARYADALAED
ncbi:hypothetical protein BHE97_02825 [Aeromicrobium sp. PE09-221]|uniref:tetratricopeptide repeat protein n=1 Tax=Aeromicrobium sp. PE09-221 TaxID=1898043 RepID=UPI000B6C5AB9|nr:tetratricopeptide repeat protein [Aeromicrobium sp. PE09-221]OUZ12233.1 hypothetical protein BHE97_02825 [Aeromicrobium sp. PE09-221]